MKQKTSYYLLVFLGSTAFLVFTISSSAQKTTIIGRVTDGRNPVELANVIAFRLPDTSHSTVYTTTDTAGYFMFQVSELPILLKVQMVGFRPASLPIEKSSFDTIATGNLVLVPLSVELKNLMVLGRRKMVLKTPTGLVLQADESITQAAGTLTDLLASTPTVVVDAEGIITIRGKTPLILVNGRNSALSASSLDKIPASSVDRIEITNTPSASNDAEAEAGIINIVLKKNLSRGANGAFSVSGGAGASFRAGSSLLFNKPEANWDLGLGYDNRFAGRSRTIKASRETYASVDERHLAQHREDDRMEKSHNLRLTAEKNINEKSSLSLEGLFEYNYNRNDETLNSILKRFDNSFSSSNVRFSHEIPVENVLELAATYTHHYKQEGRILAAGITHSFEDGDEQTHISTTPLDEAGNIIGNAYLQQTRNLEKTNITNIRFDYARPVTKHGILETGYKGTLRWFNSDFKSGEDQNGILVPNPNTSNLFDYNEQIHAGYLQFRKTGQPSKGEFSWDVGLRLEYTGNEGNSSDHSGFSNNYLKLFPTGSITTFLAKDQWIRMAYARRINRPALGSLNPFVDITDSLNKHSGNPYLQPELVHSIDLGYNHGWEKISAGINAYYRNGSNTILPYTTIDSNGVALLRPENFGNSKTSGVEMTANLAPAKLWTANVSFSVYHQTITGEKENTSINTSQWSWYTKFIANLNLWKGSKWQWLFNYQGPTAIPQGKRIAQYNLDMGLAQSCLKGKGRLGVTITDIFNTRKSGTELSSSDFQSTRYSKADTRAILLTIGYTFGSVFKEKVMKNEFNIE
jgi:outer membrane cobalamin receptor